MVSRFSSQTSAQVNRKVKVDGAVSPWNPFELDIADTSLVAINSVFRQVVFFNRGDPKFFAQWGWTDNRNRLILTTGYESRRLAEQNLSLRWNLNRQWTAQLSLAKGDRESEAELFDNKDFRIRFYQAEPQLTWLVNTQFRTQLIYRYRDNLNTLGLGAEASLLHDFRLETTMQFNGRDPDRNRDMVLRSKLSLVKVDFQGQANSPVGFALLEGLQQGNNYLWNLSLDRNLSRNLQLSLSYDGRKTGDARIVHTGRAQIAARF